MGISISRTGASGSGFEASAQAQTSAGDDKRQPCLRELQLGGVGSSRERLARLRRSRRSRPQPRRDPLKRVPRGDLRLATAIHETARWRSEQRRACLHAFDLEHRQPCLVDGFERQRPTGTAHRRPCRARQQQPASGPARGPPGNTRSRGRPAAWPSPSLATAEAASRARQAGQSALGRVPSSSPPGNGTHSESATAGSTAGL